MPATPEEMKLLVDAFEDAHPPLARALADLLVRGKEILEEHRLKEDALANDFETLVLRLSREHGVSEQTLSGTVATLRRIQVTVDQLDRLL